MQSMSVSQLAILIEQSTPVLIDVREPWEFDTCHIDGSINIPMGQIPLEFEKLDADKETVVICHHGVRSRQVILFLEQQAFENLINLEGGVDAWAREVDNEMPVY
ncbi:MAG: rhodanese-like domain-containing protein [Pseudomonadota bacterium]